MKPRAEKNHRGPEKTPSPTGGGGGAHREADGKGEGGQQWGGVGNSVVGAVRVTTVGLGSTSKNHF